MLEPKERPRELIGNTYKVIVGCGTIYVTVNHDDTGVIEIFSRLGKAGQCGASQTEALCRAVSIGLRAGVDVQSYIKQLIGIRCPKEFWDEGKLVLSCADGIARAIKKEVDKLNGVEK